MMIAKKRSHNHESDYLPITFPRKGIQNFLLEFEIAIYYGTYMLLADLTASYGNAKVLKYFRVFSCT